LYQFHKEIFVIYLTLHILIFNIFYTATSWLLFDSATIWITSFYCIIPFDLLCFTVTTTMHIPFELRHFAAITSIYTDSVHIYGQCPYIRTVSIYTDREKETRKNIFTYSGFKEKMKMTDAEWMRFSNATEKQQMHLCCSIVIKVVIYKFPGAKANVVFLLLLSRVV
jgi:hypothetical protein